MCKFRNPLCVPADLLFLTFPLPGQALSKTHDGYITFGIRDAFRRSFYFGNVFYFLMVAQLVEKQNAVVVFENANVRPVA